MGLGRIPPETGRVECMDDERVHTDVDPTPGRLLFRSQFL